jgi:hypothetical protein
MPNIRTAPECGPEVIHMLSAQARNSRKLKGAAAMQYIFRFLIGGGLVSIFAALGDVLKPKSFAGLFGAAPSIALASLGLAVAANGKEYAAIEARSMVAGAVAFVVYAVFCSRLMFRYRLRAMVVTLPALVIWLACSLSLWVFLLR